MGGLFFHSNGGKAKIYTKKSFKAVVSLTNFQEKKYSLHKKDGEYFGGSRNRL